MDGLKSLSDIERRRLRRRIAFMTGLLVLRDECEADLQEMMSQSMTDDIDIDGLSAVAAVPDGGAVKKKLGRPRREMLALPEPEPVVDPKKPKKPFFSAAKRKLQSERMRKRWAIWKKQGGKGFPAAIKLGEQAPKSAEQPPEQPPPQRQYRVPPRNTTKSKKKYSRTPVIGFGTNAEYIYQYAEDHDGIFDIVNARASAATSRNHKNLTVGGRLHVAVAESKRKGFLVHDDHIAGLYRLTPKAREIRAQELAAQGQ